MKKVLVLGSGLVAAPLIRYLLENHFRVSVASPMPSRASELVGGHPSGRVVEWSMENVQLLDEMIREHNLVVSLLPPKFHETVAGCCIAAKRHMVTTSYVQPGMLALHPKAIKAGILILNEIGLDPGIDHMSAMKIIGMVQAKGGTIEEFCSITGALPAPGANDNPFRYKFTWSPQGVLLAGKNDGMYLHRGKKVHIPTEKLFRHTFSIVFPGIGELEAYPNRDSISYRDIYGISGVKTLFRGTFRYPGWCGCMHFMKGLGLLNEEPMDLEETSFEGMIARLNNVPVDSDLQKVLASHPGYSKPAMDALQWLGLFSKDIIKRSGVSPFDITSGLMMEKMTLQPGERDMIVMQHTILARYPSGEQEVITSRLVDFGDQESTAIARTVSLPAAVAVKLILGGQISLRGVHRPTLPETYIPVLSELEKLGIRNDEATGLPLSENVCLPVHSR